MNAKDKAIELVDKFLTMQEKELNKIGCAPLDPVEHRIAKRSAIIAVKYTASLMVEGGAGWLEQMKIKEEISKL